MAVRDVIFRFDIDATPAEAGVKKFEAAADRGKSLANDLGRAGANAGTSFNQAGSAIAKSTNGIMTSLKSLGPALTAAFAVGALVNFGKESVAVFGKFQQSLASLSAITGLTGKDLEVLKRGALDLAQKTGTSADEIVKAFEKVGSARPEILGNAEALQAVTESAITLSQAAGIGLDESILAVTGTLNQFNLDASASGKIIDILAAGALAGSASIQDLSESFAKVGPVISGAGLSVEQGAALLETLAKGELKGAEAGTALRGVLLKLQADTENYTNGVFDLNKAYASLEKNQGNNIALTKQFGQEGVTAAGILATNGDLFRSLTVAVSENGIAMKQAETQTDTYEFKIKKLETSIEGLQIELGEKLAPVISDVADFFSKLISGSDELGSESTALNAIFISLSETLSAVGSFIGSIIDLGSEVFGIFGDIASAVTGSNESLDVFKAVMEALLAPVRALAEGLGYLADGVRYVRGLFEDDVTADAGEDVAKLAEVTETATKAANAHSEAVKAQGRSLTTMKAELKELQDQLEKSEVGSAEFNSLRAKIEAAKKELEKFTKDVNGPVVGSIAYLKKVISDLQKEIDEKTVPGTEKYRDKLGELEKASFDLARALQELENISPELSIKVGTDGKTNISDQLKAELEAGSEERIKAAADNGRTTTERFYEAGAEATREGEAALRAIQAEEDEIARQEKQARFAESVDTFSSLSQSILDIAGSTTTLLNQLGENEISDLEKRKAKEVELAGNNKNKILAIEKKYDSEITSLQKKAFQRNKALQIANAVVAGAMGVMQVLSGQATGNVIADAIIKGVQIAAVVATTALQVATIARQKFAKGGLNIQGPGTGTSDSIPAMISRGESVITAQKTADYLPTLKAVHEGRISPAVLNSFVQSQTQGTPTFNYSNSTKNISQLDDRRMVEQLIALNEKASRKGPQYIINYRRSANA